MGLRDRKKDKSYLWLFVLRTNGRKILKESGGILSHTKAGNFHICLYLGLMEEDTRIKSHIGTNNILLLLHPT